MNPFHLFRDDRPFRFIVFDEIKIHTYQIKEFLFLEINVCIRLR